MDLDFGELSKDKDIVERLQEFKKTSVKIDETLKLATNSEFYDELTKTDKIKFNLLMSFSLNGLYWMYLRANGQDPNKNQIKSENDRLKKAMKRSQEIKDKKTMMRRIDQDAAKRFVRNSLWVPKNNNDLQNVDAREESWDIPSATSDAQKK